MIMSALKQCQTCRFWDAHSDEDQLGEEGEIISGECRRYAPRAASPYLPLHIKQDAFVTFPAWPVTSPLEWCGEWEGHGDG